MKRFNKRGSHVGMVLSFVIFITFIFFFYVVFEPSLKSSNEKEIILDNIEVKMKDNLESSLGILTVSGKDKIDKKCIEINLDNYFGDYDFFVIKLEDGSLVDYFPSGDSLIKTKWDSKINRVKVYGSENLEQEEEDDLKCKDSIIINSNDFNIDYLENEYFDKTKIIEAINHYDEDYDNFINEFEIGYNNFEFSFEDSSGEVFEPERETYKPSMTDVYARNLPIVYFDEDATIQSGRLNLKIW